MPQQITKESALKKRYYDVEITLVDGESVDLVVNQAEAFYIAWKEYLRGGLDAPRGYEYEKDETMVSLLFRNIKSVTRKKIVVNNATEFEKHDMPITVK